MRWTYNLNPFILMILFQPIFSPLNICRGYLLISCKLSPTTHVRALSVARQRVYCTVAHKSRPSCFVTPELYFHQGCYLMCGLLITDTTAAAVCSNVHARWVQMPYYWFIAVLRWIFQCSPPEATRMRDECQPISLTQPCSRSGVMLEDLMCVEASNGDD